MWRFELLMILNTISCIITLLLTCQLLLSRHGHSTHARIKAAIVPHLNSHAEAQTHHRLFARVRLLIVLLLSSLCCTELPRSFYRMVSYLACMPLIHALGQQSLVLGWLGRVVQLL